MDAQILVLAAQAGLTLAPTLFFAVGYNAGLYLPIYTVTSALVCMVAITAGTWSLGCSNVDLL